MEQPPLKQIVEGLLLAAGRPLNLDQFIALFPEEEGEVPPTREALREALQELAAEYEGRSFELKEIASGWRIQVREGLARWVSRLWDDKPARYSRALLETLALIAYRQPITRGEIEEVRGVAVSSNIVKTLMEREWVRVVGHRDVPGRPAMYATTRQFLDYFNLKSLADLPTLAELRDLDQIASELEGMLDLPPAEDGEESPPEAGEGLGAGAAAVGDGGGDSPPSEHDSDNEAEERP